MIGIELGTCSWRYYRHHRIEKPMALTRFTEQLRDTQYVEFFLPCCASGQKSAQNDRKHDWH